MIFIGGWRDTQSDPAQSFGTWVPPSLPEEVFETRPAAGKKDCQGRITFSRKLDLLPSRIALACAYRIEMMMINQGRCVMYIIIMKS